MEKLVSVIVPVRKGEKYLEECLKSIKSQDYNLQLVIESDKKETGPASTRNRALDKATGKYVLFCDSDDYLEPEAIDLLLKEIEGVDLVCGSFRKFGDFEMTVTHPTQILGMTEVADYVMSNLKDPGHNQMFSGCWAKLFKRELIGRFPDILTAEDMAFNFDYLTRCNNVKFLSDVVYHNRKRQGSMTTTFDEKNKPGLFGFLTGLKYVRMFLKDFCMSNEIDDALDSSKVYHSLLYFTRIAGVGRETFRKLYP